MIKGCSLVIRGPFKHLLIQGTKLSDDKKSEPQFEHGTYDSDEFCDPEQSMVAASLVLSTSLFGLVPEKITELLILQWTDEQDGVWPKYKRIGKGTVYFLNEQHEDGDPFET
jgi:hypothetical protein